MRHGTALTTSVPPRLFPEKGGKSRDYHSLFLSITPVRSPAESHPPRSASSRRSINLSNELSLPVCSLTGVTLANWLVLLPSEIKHRSIAGNKTVFFIQFDVYSNNPSESTKIPLITLREFSFKLFRVKFALKFFPRRKRTAILLPPFITIALRFIHLAEVTRTYRFNQL